MATPDPVARLIAACRALNIEIDPRWDVLWIGAKGAPLIRTAWSPVATILESDAQATRHLFGELREALYALDTLYPDEPQEEQ